MNKSVDKSKHSFTRFFKRALAVCLVSFAALIPVNTFAHNVGQVQTTKYFTPETIALLQQNAINGVVGFQVGDIVSYIISFQPIANGAQTGAGGYITDYIPAGTQVVDAAFVTPSGTTYANVTPSLPGAMPAGSGGAPVNTFLAPFVGFPSAKLSDMYADTGIFFSTDSRTALDPTTKAGSGAVAQGLPGYNVNPTRGAALAALINPAVATMTTHNLWDADQTNAFGTTTLPAAAPKSARLKSINNGSGPTPVNVGTPVAGPQSGFQLDDTGSIGPWQRIAYPGSTIGCATPCTAGLAGGALTVSGTSTSLGWVLSTANPLPATTNAVRWSVGELIVGQPRYVKISLKLTAPIPAGGLVNNGEVAGGDASGSIATLPRDNAWTYWVSSVANNNSSLFVYKEITNVCTVAPVAPLTAASCPASNGASLPANAIVRYKISYLNTSNSVQTNLKLVDTLPTQVTGSTVAATLATSVKNFAVLSGPNIIPPVLTVAPLATSSATVTFATIPTLGAGLGGAVAFDVALTAAAPAVVKNTATLTSTAVPGGVNSIMTSNVVGTVAQLTMSKSVNTPSSLTGGTVSYTITVTNTGTASAVVTTITDTLPGSGTGNVPAARFTYVPNAAAPAVQTTVLTNNGVVAAAPTAVVTVPAAAAPNQELVTFTLPAATTILPNTTLTLQFNALVGANVVATTTPYTNSAQVNFTGGAAGVTNVLVANTAPVTVNSAALSITKSIDCVYTGAVCNAYVAGATLPVNAKLRYKLHYANTGTVAQTNVLLCDQLISNQVTALTGTITTPVTVAPTPVGPFANTAAPNGPAAGAITNPAAAACGFAAGGVSFSYPAIASLAVGAAGDVYFDVLTNATNPSTLTNTAKIVSTLVPGGAVSTVSAQVNDYAQLQVTKTTTTPSISANGIATYVITVKNTGTIAASAIKIYDELPFTGAAVLATGRFNYVATTAISAPMTAVAPTLNTAAPFTAPLVAAGPPTLAGYAANLNQQEIVWNFGAQTLAAGASFTITFTAQAGSTIPAGTTTYYNDAIASYTSGVTALSAAAVNSAPITIATNLLVSKTIDCIYDAALTTCTAYNGSGLIPVNAKVRYKIAYQNTAATAQTNVYLCDQITSNQAVALTATISQPTIAPTPVGPFTDTPVIGVPVTPANALCAFPALVAPVTGVSFSYPVIASLAAGASGVVYLDLATNAASGATINNTAKLVSTQAPSGQTSVVSNSALNVPNLKISKTTSTANTSINGTVTYTITITNTGSAPTTSLKVYDFLPFSGTVLDTTKRFSYSGPTTLSGGLAAVAPATGAATVSVPTISPYSGNANQQQVLWDFGAYALAVNATVTLTFSATVGSAMPVGFYNNSALVDYGNPTGVNSQSVVNGAATVAVTNSPVITLKKVVSAYYDPINLLVKPVFLPGGISEYTVSASNAGGVADSNSISITDAVPPNTSLYVKDIGVPGSGPIAFTDGTPSSGLTYAPANVSFFGGLPVPAWGYVPVPNAVTGCDPLVTNFRVSPQGIFAGNPTAPSPNFSFKFRVCLQ